LQRERLAMYVEASGLCAVCQRVVRFDEMIRDHVVPLAEGGREEPANIQPICATCHARKTADEARRGIRRDRGV